MISLRVRARFEKRRVQSAVQRANITSLRHAGASLRLTASRSIRKRKKAAPEGQPPHTRQGQLRRAIRFAVEGRKERVVIGPAASVVGPSGAAHEHGGRFRGQRFPKRPFMGPALQVIQPRLTKLWANSVR